MIQSLNALAQIFHLTRNELQLLIFKYLSDNLQRMLSPHNIQDFPPNFLVRKFSVNGQFPKI